MDLLYYIDENNGNNVKQKLHKVIWFVTLDLLLVIKCTVIMWVYERDEIFWNRFQNKYLGVNRGLMGGCDNG